MSGSDHSSTDHAPGQVAAISSTDGVMGAFKSPGHSGPGHGVHGHPASQRGPGSGRKPKTPKMPKLGTPTAASSTHMGGSNGLGSEHNGGPNHGGPNGTSVGGSERGDKKKKRKRCGECNGCQRKDNCSECAPCRNDKSHQICKMRRCEKLTEKKPKGPAGANGATGSNATKSGVSKYKCCNMCLNVEIYRFDKEYHPISIHFFLFYIWSRAVDIQLQSREMPSNYNTADYDFSNVINFCPCHGFSFFITLFNVRFISTRCQP